MDLLKLLEMSNEESPERPLHHMSKWLRCCACHGGGAAAEDGAWALNLDLKLSQEAKGAELLHGRRESA